MGRFVLIVFIVFIIIIDIYLFKQIFFTGNNTPEEKTVEIKKGTPVEKSTGAQAEIKTIPSAKEPLEAPKKRRQPLLQEEKPVKEEKKLMVRKEIKTNGYMVADVFVNLRAKPDVNSEVVTVIKKGARVKIIGRKAKHWKKRSLYPCQMGEGLVVGSRPPAFTLSKRVLKIF
ncbi:MAG: SH3 domain-containing protein [Persephonella sp.]|nr:SH3 domain-containing protein [Persephonella sp.]